MKRRQFLSLLPLSLFSLAPGGTPSPPESKPPAVNVDPQAVEITEPISKIVILDSRQYPNARIDMVESGGKTLIRVV